MSEMCKGERRPFSQEMCNGNVVWILLDLIRKLLDLQERPGIPRYLCLSKYIFMANYSVCRIDKQQYFCTLTKGRTERQITSVTQ
jgi:hypothetical protein